MQARDSKSSSHMQMRACLQHLLTVSGSQRMQHGEAQHGTARHSTAQHSSWLLSRYGERLLKEKAVQNMCLAQTIFNQVSLPEASEQCTSHVSITLYAKHITPYTACSHFVALAGETALAEETAWTKSLSAGKNSQRLLQHTATHLM